MTPEPRVQIRYRRPPNREQIFDQAVAFEDDSVIVTLAESISFGEPMRIDGTVVLERGSSVVWFTFPGAWHDIGRFHRADDSFTGIYANILTPVSIDGRRWETTDLFLDVWVGSDGSSRILDVDEFDAAVEADWIDRATAERARDEADRLAKEAAVGSWPPPIVEDWTLERARAAVGRASGS